MFSSSQPSGLLGEVFQYIDVHQDDFVQTLKEWVAIESNSVQPEPRFRQELFRMMGLAADKLRRLGASVDSVDVGHQQLPDGQTLPIPPIVLAELGNDPKKPTVCFYGHLDVQPARPEDGWLTNPYTLTEVDGKLYGRGATDNKGPVLAWIHAVSAFKALDQDLPVNIKFIIEGMEEAGSVALEELVHREKDRFFSSVEYIVISDNLWISQRKPALTYGTRGNSYFTVEDGRAACSCATEPGTVLKTATTQKSHRVLHQGPHVHALVISRCFAFYIDFVGSLVDSSGHILIPGIYDHVAPLTEEEKKLYEAIDLDLGEYRNSSQVEKFLFDTKEEVLMHLWRYPSLSIHGIEGAYDEPGMKTVIPGRVIGKFSIRLVPHMNMSVVEKQVVQHLQDVFSRRNSSNKMAVSMTLGLHPWIADINDNQYLAAKRAIRTVFGTDPDMIRDGSTIPIAKIFQEILQKSVMMLPLGAVDDGEHSQNEKINRSFIELIELDICQNRFGLTLTETPSALLMMNSENKPENDEDENINKEAKGSRNISSLNEDCEPVSDVIANSSENSMNKRVFSDSSNTDSVVAAEDRNKHASKRVKLDEAEALKPGEPGVHGPEASESSGTGVDVLGSRTVREALLKDCSDGDARPSDAFSPCGFSTIDTFSLKTDTEKKSTRDMVSCDLERASPVPVKEASVGCTVGSVETVLKCSICGSLFSSCSDLEKHAECHVPQSKEHTCCHCGHEADSSSALHVHTRQTHGLQKAFACDLCGFQCVEENLLHAHYLGKTHLRRQNLAARGGFIHILTKQPFPKKPCTVGTRNVQAKPRVSKPIVKKSDSKGLRNVGSKFQGLRGSISKQRGDSSELPVEVMSSQSTSSENSEIVGENVTSLGQKPEHQNEKLSTLVISEGLSDKMEKNTLQTAHSISPTSRPRPERNILMLGNSLRRRSSTFTLKGQTKKRLNLLGMNKRGTNETQRMYMKHLRAQMKTSDSESMSKKMEMSSNVQSLCVTTSETQEPMQDKRNSHLLGSTQLDSLAVKPASDPQLLYTCIDCGQIAANSVDLETHVRRCHAQETKFYCQTCGISTVSRKDLDEHLHSNQHQQTASVLSCQCCSFISLNETNLRDHMKEKHSMGFLCTPCNLFFLSEKDMEEHRATERHVSSLVQPETSQSLNSDLVLQTLPLSTLESENTKDSVSQSGKAVQEEPKSRVSHGNEVRHSSKPQFQCKKCFYKTRSSTVLTRHIKLRHGQDYHFLCKACNLYSLSKEGMEKHIKRSKHLENAKKNNIGLSFDECIERVCIGANDKKEEFNVSGSGKIEGHAGVQEHSYLEKSILTHKELSQSGSVVTKDDELALATTPKRGRPKGNVSRTCSHCGLLASSITNLTVHIRRKHSHQYSYLCKVCKYYTVTKGDMERHCATKKHKGRVEVEANGKQSSDIVVGPEGGNLEACRRNTSLAAVISDEPTNKLTESDPSVIEKPVVGHGNPAEVEVENVFPSIDGEVNSHLTAKKEQVSVEPDDLLQEGDAYSQGDVTSSGDNKCVHCEFSAHSPASLELHVKRRHTKEFEFYCMACDYYAVTRREMTRHAATEKHKTKRQSYLNPSSVEAGSSEMAKNIIIPEEEQQANSEEFQIIADQPSDSLRSRNGTGSSVLDENTNLDMSKVFCASDSVEIETEESNFSEDHSFCETFQQSLGKEKVMKPEEMVPLTISSNYGSPNKFQNGNLGSSASNCEIAKKNHEMLTDVGSPHLRCGSVGESTGGGGGKVLHKQLCPGVLEGEQSAESTTPVVMRIAREQLNPDSGGQNQVPHAHGSEDLKSVQGDPILENKELLMNSQHETKMILEEDGPASDSTVESSDVYETIISIDDKGQAMYSFGRFDSSIIRIKNSEDGELMDQSEEGLLAMGVRISELPLKDCTQGLKKKKAEGTSFGESTRIRCDDCGFLADGLSGLNVHIAMKHPTKEKHFHCLLCGKSFYTESNLHQHLASAGHMRNEQASVEELPEGGATFKCVKCTEPFDSEQNLFLHIKGQHEELLREVNKYIVEDTEQINREREENQGNVCKYCGKMCRSSNSMAFLAHIRTHTALISYNVDETIKLQDCLKPFSL
ncbi:Zinc finger protein 407 [Tupaia chinensis]|uniref:Zinc finger protein 407 n=1 Tax=Tupaia chinensis TaxID=246437 RepID=L8Y755_TUPCH|nr:Zinc finger protein 407 [Tupaia chinensis]